MNNNNNNNTSDSRLYTIPILNRILSFPLFQYLFSEEEDPDGLLPSSYSRGSSSSNFILRFRIPRRITESITSIGDYIIYFLGPMLIILASALIGGLTYCFFTVGFPNIAPHGIFSFSGIFHLSIVAFLLVNVVYNYVLCVSTSNKGPSYDRVVRELADATGYVYPETQEEIADAKRECEQRLLARARIRRGQNRPVAVPAVSNNGTSTPSSATTTAAAAATTTTSLSTNRPASSTSTGGTTTATSSRSTNQTVPGWMLVGPQEWSFCTKSNQPKPPRAHYDHVMRNLVLNMDHYCPWMFNTVGYFNYRYFCNFLLYVTLGMTYGALISYRLFMNLYSPLYRQQIKLSRSKGFGSVQHLLPMVPTPEERSAVSFSFMLCISVGIAVCCLFCFHLYLIFTAQTTIEFHGNCSNKRRAIRYGTRWLNPYDLGLKRNWQIVYGSSLSPLYALLPSNREPEFLPIPIGGELRRRKKKAKEDSPSSSSDVVIGLGSSDVSVSGSGGGGVGRRGQTLQV